VVASALSSFGMVRRVIHRRDAEGPRPAEESLNEISEAVIGAAIEVHRHLGPGLLESIYEECLGRELSLRRIPFQRQAPVGGTYKGMKLGVSFRVDLKVCRVLLVELKAVEALHDVHTAHLLSYLRLADLRLGLLINFNVPVLWRGVRRVANRL
jgi:GxxExxY protein